MVLTLVFCLAVFQKYMFFMIVAEIFLQFSISCISVAFDQAVFDSNV